MNEPIELKLMKENQKSKRIQETKMLCKMYSKEVVNLYRQYEEMTRKQQEYKEAIEIYKKIISEIEDLKRTRNDILEQREKAEIDKERERKLLEEYNEKIRQKNIQFNIFMEKKGKEAFEYFRNLKRAKERLDEEIHRCQKKKTTKAIYTEKAKRLVENYKEMENQKMMEEIQNAEENSAMNTLYKLTTPFHNNGNKIDYSTTRFHNIVVLKHKDELAEYINAFDKAKEESEKTVQRKKSKDKQIENFNKNMETNYKELIRKNRAKENLERLNAEFEKINKAEKQIKSNKANLNYNSTNAKGLEKKSEFIMNKLLNLQKSKRTKILNDENSPRDDEKASYADEDSIRSFYKDDSIIKNKEDDYFSREIKEHNENIDSNHKPFYYEEPIARDKKPLREKITRVNPVDLESYQKAEYEEEVNAVHKDPIVSLATNVRNSLRVDSIMSGSVLENSTFSILDALNITKKSSVEDQRGNKAVKDFVKKIDGAVPGKGKKGVVMNTNLWNIEEEVEGIGFEEKPKKKSKPNSSKNVKFEDIKEIKEESSKNVMPKALGVVEETKEENKEEKNNPSNGQNEVKKDDSKWKYSKQELFERKKKLLKDKSNIHK